MCMLIRYQSGMVVRMPVSSNQLFNDQPITVSNFLKCLYVELAMDSMEHKIN